MILMRQPQQAASVSSIWRNRVVILSTRQLIRYGAVGALAVVVVAGAVYFFDRSPTASPATTADGANPPAAADPSSAATPSVAANPATPAVNPNEPVVPSEAQTDQIARLLGDAHRLAADGNFAEAKAALDKADAVNKALAEAEKLNPQAPEIAQLRQALLAAQQKETHRNSRIVELLTTMREAIARHDFAAADGALNEAERINIRDPAVDQARSELARAHDADRKSKAEK